MKVVNFIHHMPTDREKYTAEFDVEGFEVKVADKVYSMALKRFRLVPGKKDGFFISWPAYPIQNDEDGSRKYVNFAEFLPEVKKLIDQELYAQLKPLCSTTTSTCPF